jgi:amino acid adenylation domain-containing protein
MTVDSDCRANATNNFSALTKEVNHFRSLSHTVVLPESSSQDILTIVLAAWTRILSVHLASKDVVFGIAIGAQILRFHCTASRDMTIGEYLDHIRQSVHGASAEPTILHEIESNQIEPLLRTVVNVGQMKSHVDELSIGHAPVDWCLNIFCEPTSQHLNLHATLDTRYIATFRAKNLLYEIAQVSAGLLLSPSHWPLKEIQVISQEEEKTIFALNSLNIEPSDTCIHDIISKWAKTQPYAEALCAPDGSFSFSELDSLSSRLAHRLQQQGVRPGELIPLGMERSALAVITMIAVLKTGSAFIPLEVASPIGRNLEIVKQSGAKRVLISEIQTTKGWPAEISALVSLKKIRSTPLPDVGTLPSVDLQSLAYVIFTSGSTGKPKGVMIEHHSLSASIRSERQPYIFNQSTATRALHFASLAFDASFAEHLAPLSNGGCVYIPDQEARLDGLVEFMNRNRINWAFFTPSFFRLLDPDELPWLDTVVLGGEAINDECIDRWAHRIRLVNGYGPSETTICVTACVVDPSSENRASIGTGMVSKVWVVDPEDPDQLSPIGTVGELLIQGPTVGRGYLGDESRTKASFIERPRWLRNHTEHHERIYRTGDLVRFEPDGSLTYVGRRDTQIKIRGHRVELSEIESKISVNKSVDDVVLLAPKAGPLKGQLTAIIALKATAKQTHEHVRSTLSCLHGQERAQAMNQIDSVKKNLQEHLPNYMIPTAWLPVLTIPLSTSAKADRTLLSQWLENDSETHSLVDDGVMHKRNQSVLPRNKTEELLQRIWASVLNSDGHRVPIDLSLQSLGGDSLAAIQIVAECRKERMTISMSNLLRGDSIIKLAQNAGLVTNLSPDLENEVAFPLSPIQKIYTKRAPLDKHHFYQVMLLKVSVGTPIPRIEESVREVVKRHSMLRLRLQPSSLGFMQEISDRPPSISIHHIPDYTAEDVMKMSHEHLDPYSGVSFHADILQTESRLLLFLVGHHLAVDLVSWNIIISDLEQFIRFNHLPQFEATTFQTWCNYLQHLKPQKALPYTIPPPNFDLWGMHGKPNTYGDVIHYTARLKHRQLTDLLSFTQNFYINLLDVFLASLFLGFRRVFKRDATIHNESHGREHSNPLLDISGTVGWFTTLLPLAPRIKSGASLLEGSRIVQFSRTAVPDNGLSHFTSNVLNQDELDVFEIVFNYMGSTFSMTREESVFQIEPHSVGVSGDSASNNMSRLTLIEISAVVVNHEVELVFSCNRHMTGLNSIRKWVVECVGLLTQASSFVGTTTSQPSHLLANDYYEACDIVERAYQTLGVDSSNVDSIYPTSPMQNAMLIAQASAPESYQAKLLLGIKSRDQFDMSRFQKAWTIVVRDNPILRTVFVPRRTDVYDQVVLNNNIIDSRIAQVENIFPSNLARMTSSWKVLQPHNKLTVTYNGNYATCLLEIDHSLIDHVSLQHLLCYLSEIYTGSIDTVFATPQVNYDLFIEHLAQHDSKTSIDYWRAAFPRTLRNSLTYPSSSLNSNRKLRHSQISLSEPVKSALVSSIHTPSAILRLCWALALQKQTGSQNPQFGYVGSGRDVSIANTESGRIAGPLLNILPCTIDLGTLFIADHIAKQKLQDLLEDIQIQYARSLPHQHWFFTYATEVREQRKLSEPPTRLFFDTVVNFRRHVSQPETSSLEFTIVGEIDPFDVNSPFPLK